MNAATGWKLFAVLDGVLVLKTIVAPTGTAPLDAFAILNLTMSAAASVGLLLYAFQLPALARPVWQMFAPAFAIYSVYIVSHMATNMARQPIGNGDQLIGMVGALALCGALQYFTWLGLHRYAKAAIAPA